MTSTLSPTQTTTSGSERTATAQRVATARMTGLFYLGLAITGMLGFLVVRPALYVEDASTTLSNLVEREGLARIGVALELGIVVTQALAALWFYRLFRAVDAFAAGAIAVFGMVNAVAILGSAASMGAAVELANDSAGDAGGVRLLALLSENLWAGGAIFFGLWLIPMGLCVLRSGWMPAGLGRILVVGGVGYVVSAFVAYLAPSLSVVAELLTVPASIGEFWMIGYLLWRGVRRPA